MSLILSFLNSNKFKYQTLFIEYTVTSLEGIISPQVLEEWYILPAVQDTFTKTSAKFGSVTLSVCKDLYELLELYVKFARKILTRNTPEEALISTNHLWVTQKGYVLTSKAVSDIIARTISCGNFGVVTSRSIRSTLATLGEQVRLSNITHPAHNYVTSALSYELRHSVMMHQRTYVQNNLPLKNVRSAKFLAKICQNKPITSADISSLADEHIVQSIIPSFSEAVDNTFLASQNMPTPRGYDPSTNRKHIYQLILELFAGQFTIHSDISAKSLKARLLENSHLQQDIKDTLRLSNLQNMKSLQQRCVTYKRFLERKL